ncbi:MAG: 4-hydroxyphenylacetate 3-monooxygenase, oxygenase component [Candidatus Carbobacillus sp.]|nr:4-hydroxyphenylacetate 3-monooxygenase, oxygenase component [Candidatus Carbobacillus sp.]
MPAKNGKAYKERLKQNKAAVYIGGEKVEDVTVHPAFSGVVESMAELYDLQYTHKDKMLYPSPTTGDPVGITFLRPETIDDLIARREAMQIWARHHGGLMGRAPDYLNVEVMTMDAAADFFAEDDPRFAQNARDYYAYCRENDISLTHTLIQPQINRSKAQFEQNAPDVPLHIVKETEDGLIVHGIRLLATQGAITDEILVFPSTVNKADVRDNPYALAFAIPNNTPGVKFISRESFVYSQNRFDYPLSARFEEGDAIVSFENVLVPWERVFIRGRSDLANRYFRDTNAVVHMSHQVVAKNVVKTEFILGTTLMLIDAIGIEQFQHVKDKATEIMLVLETMRSHLYRAEHAASLDRWGVMTPDFTALDAARNWYPRMYPRLAEILRILGASGLSALPVEADFSHPEIGEIVRKGMQGAHIDGYERVQMFRLVWDLVMSAFGTRQTHYEYYFFGDPIRMGMAYFDHYAAKEAYKEYARSFLGHSFALSAAHEA